MSRLLDKLLEDTIAEVTQVWGAGDKKPEVRVERYWTAPGDRWFSDHAEARKITGMAISVWACQRGKKELNDKKPPNWSMNL